MKKLKTTLEIICGILLMCTLDACITPQTTIRSVKTEPTIVPIQLQYNPNQMFTRYSNIVNGIVLNVIDASDNNQMGSGQQVVTFQRITVNQNLDNVIIAKYSFTPSKDSFVKESLKQHMRSMGFVVDQFTGVNYVMNVVIESFNVHSGTSNKGIKLNITVFDPNGNSVYSTSVLGKPSTATSTSFNDGYLNAINQIDWGAIAKQLQGSNLQVQGYGNTALEHTIINWEVTSRPAGADLYWRVISSTPDVKNTNKNYKSTTPYESTESFDIRGLTYQNSGDVQIELTCEKPGYLPQRKVFNVRMCLDQKSINAHFTLVKDE